MAKIYDVFTFFNELDLLELRLDMLHPFVDKFVIIECVETFSGNKKPLYYEENKDRFKKYHDKIIHHITYDPPKSFEDLRQRIIDSNSDDLMKQICTQALTSSNVPKGELHWLKEFYQKENIRRALIGLEDEDLCFIGDLDEFWNPELVYNFVEDHKLYKLKQIAYSLYLNNRSSEPWAATMLSKYKTIKNACLNHLRNPNKTEYEYVNNGGWHFTFMGGEDQIKLKLESYGHQEYNNDKIKSEIKNNLESNKDVLGRSNFNFWIDESQLPKYIIENKQKYIKFFKNKIESKMKLKIDKKRVQEQDINFFINEVNIDWPLRGGEHYKLMTYIANEVNGENIVDAGTYQGLSCLSLAQNKNNTIYTYDIFPVNIPFLNAYENVVIKTKDINQESDDFIKSCKIILLDVDPHDGIQEQVFSDKMKKIGYEGFVICDDIYLNDRMRSWWESIEEVKHDLTDVGHSHGTGVICYGNVELSII